MTGEDLSSLKIDRSKKSVNPEQKQKIIKLVLLTILSLIIAFIIYFGWIKLTSSTIEVTTTTATIQSSSQSNAFLTASGYVVAQRKAAVASKGMGRLVYLGVVEGDKVFTNQIIARLEDSDIKAQLEQAEANLKLVESELIDAENNYNRQKQLLQTGSTSQMQVEAAEYRYKRVLASIEVAKAQILSVQVALENTLIRAPFNGTVLTKNADVGEVVAPLGAGINAKAAVVTIADMNSLQVEADVSESNIEKIEVGQNCQITLDAYPEKNYKGYVAKIVPTADRGKATVMVKIGFKEYDKKVLPEMSAKVLFMKNDSKEVENEKPVLVIPKSALAIRNGNKVVYKVFDDKAIEVPVQTGKEFDSYIEIKSGLENGDKIIDKVTDEIKHYSKIKVN
ncbi:efflux RND transporter periplasmic adaptor subunit [Stygiobacter electus]|uniref:Efflux RND transporter periplasmic adaptor subunit n=1 Tax=Stygiobacter electus TaxID=3032292 RepID=A0AAE3TB12_9BACT|nr:efflux RND transporter periplasmic adaptor subunit [Stygiobacter electus]MDF1610828.1 efflux RND transporter periplasmic adaptor subunit [Stygiobacter electus]